MNNVVRMIFLRNCGRFLNIASDFGSSYKTQTFVSSEALYVGLTREKVRKEPKFIDLENDQYDFFQTFDVSKFPVVFTPGIFVERNSPDRILRKSLNNSDVNTFNILDEDYPRTGSKRDYQRTERYYRGNRPHYCPTYGSMESILPNNLIRTFAISNNKELLEIYENGQTFLLGKKRTMFQIEYLSEIVEALESPKGQVLPTQIQFPELKNFVRSIILTSTRRFLLATGEYNKPILTAKIDNNDFGFPIEVFERYSQ